MRKVLFLILTMTLLLVGCGGNSEPTEEMGKKRIEVNEEMKVANVTANISSITIEEGTIEIPIAWQHWAGNDKVHFSVLAFPAVYQGDQHLEMISGQDSMHKKVDKGIDSMAMLTYKLIDETTPVTIKIIATTDDMEEETVTVKID
jgi:PBP1b-binding outer membrane lipoprotein LpoB